MTARVSVDVVIGAEVVDTKTVSIVVLEMVIEGRTVLVVKLADVSVTVRVPEVEVTLGYRGPFP
jgi:hypothetical protein